MWIAAFKLERQTVKDYHRSGRKTEVIDRYYAEKVREIIEKYRRYTWTVFLMNSELVNGLFIPFSPLVMGYARWLLDWVPHCLTQSAHGRDRKYIVSAA